MDSIRHPAPGSAALGSKYDMPEAFTVVRVKKENYRISTISFDRPLPSRPGQFVMMWLPGVNERPISIHGPDPLSLSVAKVGEFSSKALELKPGDKVGIRGPYGNSFKLQGRNILLVGGGYGLMPLYFLAVEARKRKIGVTVVAGARKAEDVVLEEDFKRLGCRMSVCTDDGSRGSKGYCTQDADSILSKERFSAVYGCGPEMMEVELVRVCARRRVPVWVSVERMMKCGFGVCGECACGDRLVCAQGTVFGGGDLAKNPDFGKSYLDWGGKRQSYSKA
ncbi:MAG: dihydroorotate dehydrogenase electron transfer subunit [Candidatus Micrarchaeota archaeon]